MIIKLLGFMDLLAGIILLLNIFIDIKPLILILFGIYLIVKGITFWGDVLSVVDLIIGLYLFLNLFIHPGRINLSIAAFLIIKGISSMA